MIWTCAKCAKKLETAKERLPRNWKRIGETLLCAECSSDSYAIRALSFQVVGPDGSKDHKDAFWNALRAGWRDVTFLSNWMMRECAEVDSSKQSQDPKEKMPKPPLPYLYPEARKLRPMLFCSTIAQVEQMVKRKYSQMRFDMWLGKVSLPVFRYAHPLPLPAAVWRAEWLSLTERVPYIRVNLSGVRFRVRLKGGPGFRPQLRDFGDLVNGSALRCQMIFTPKGEGAMAKLIIRAPKKVAEKVPGRSMAVKTDKESLLVWSIDEKEIFRLNADHLRRWIAEMKRRIAEHDRLLARLREDRKMGRTTMELSDPKTFRERIVAKHSRRMDSLTHQAAAAAVAGAVRLKCSTIIYDDSDRGYAEHFPWANLKTKIEQKANAAGLEFVAVKNATQS